MGRKKKRLRLLAKLEANKATPAVEVAKAIEPIVEEVALVVDTKSSEDVVEETKVEQEAIVVEKAYKKPTKKTTTRKATTKKSVSRKGTTSRKRNNTSKK